MSRRRTALRGPAALGAAAVFALAVCGLAVAQDPAGRIVERRGDLVSIFSGDIHIDRDERVRGSVVCIWGDVTIEGEVTQDVVVILGSLDLRGQVGGAVTGVLSEFEIRGARIGGELVGVLTGLELDDTRIGRDMVNILGTLNRDELTRVAGEFVNIGFGSWAPSFWALLFWGRLFHKFVVFVLLVALVALVPERIRAIGEEAPVRYLTAFLVGLLGYLGMLVVASLLFVTVVGMPLALLAFYVFKWLGIAGIFFAVGHRIGRVVGVDLSVAGAVLLVFAVYVASSLAPAALGGPGLLLVLALRVLFFFLFEVPGVGLVLLTRVGSPREPPAAPQPGPPLPAAGSSS